MGKTVKSKKSGLRAINDLYIIEEDPIEKTYQGSLHIPDAYEFFDKKFPFRGTVISKGDKTKYEDVQVGTRIMFARLGGQRWEENGKQYLTIREDDIHAIIP